ncbi:terpene synthase-like [Ptiloglossa arizonensis]|uniref:terpene synthase-like n=1 Tax=Ptiloglossa arizonensis TaxID=3350558 RepID=UPI003F9EFCD5
MAQYENELYLSFGNNEEDKALLEPFNYLVPVIGKTIDLRLSEALNYWLKVPQDKFCVIRDIIQTVYIYSILIDDIQDDSELRKNKPVAHNIYGIAGTINAANYSLLVALEKVFALHHSESVKVYGEQLKELHKGQGLEIYWRDNYICPSETAYKKMTTLKTGTFYKLALRLMQEFSECKEDFSFLIETLSIYKQIRNDYFNLYHEKNVDTRTYADDITTGNFSFPIVHAIQSHPDDKQIMNILRQRTKDIDIKRYCVSMLKKFGSFDYTRTVLKELDKKVREEVQRLGGNPLLVQILDELMNWKIQDVE